MKTQISKYSWSFVAGTSDRPHIYSVMKVGLSFTFLILSTCSEAKQASLPPAPSQFERVSTKESAPQTVPAAARMIIRTANLTLIVDNAGDSLSRIVAIVQTQGGYVAETRQWRENDQIRSSATLRVPAEKLGATLSEIRKQAIRVNDETISGQDVSEEYADLGAQLTNLRATEAELRQLLTTIRERTQKAADVLEVHRELSRVRGDIDRLQGRADYLKQMTAMSTIKVDLIPDQLFQPIIEVGWRPMAIAKNAVRTLVAGLEGLGTILIFLIVVVLPLTAILVAIAIPVRMLWSAGKRWRGTNVPPPAASAT